MGAASEPAKRHLMAMRPVASAVSGRTEARRIGFVQLLTLFKLHAKVVTPPPLGLPWRGSAKSAVCGR